MQIKRFEAADMTDALRMVKREFGDDAVILSAKEVRPGGFFSALRKKSVEITAATDYPVNEDIPGDDFSEMLTEHLDAEAENDRVSLSSTRQTINPFAPNVRSMAHKHQATERRIGGSDMSDTRQNNDRVIDKVAPDERKTGGGHGAGAVSTVDWIRQAARNNLVAEPFYRDFNKQKTIALVGPSGVGKSTAVAKLALHCLKVEKKRIGLISLDRFRIHANSMLAGVARIMNLSLRVVHDAGQLQTAVNELVDVDVILIDTPGMNRRDELMMDDVGALLRLAKPDETHLVANATVRDEVMTAAVNTFSPLGVNRLLLSHVEECSRHISIMNLLENIRIPVSFYADGVDLFDGLQETSAKRLAGQSLRFEPSGGQVTAFAAKRKREETGSAAGARSSELFQYVANRNSELFHHPTCKSVKRINAENIVAFNSIEQALDEGFKPCRSCCEISMTRKPVTGAFGYRRASAI